MRLMTVNVKLLPILGQRGIITRFFCKSGFDPVKQISSPVCIRSQLARSNYLGEKSELLLRNIRGRRVHPAVVSIRFFATKRHSDPPR